jgi:hypothetical protein
VRFDAIAHRDVTTATAAFYPDGSVLLPLVNHVAVSAGTVQHG